MVKTTQIAREETRCRHMGYSFRLAAMGLLYASSHRQDNTYHSLCYTSRGALAGTRNSWMGPPHEGSIRRPIAPWANALTTELHLAPSTKEDQHQTEWNSGRCCTPLYCLNSPQLQGVGEYLTWSTARRVHKDVLGIGKLRIVWLDGEEISTEEFGILHPNPDKQRLHGVQAGAVAVEGKDLPTMTAD